MSEEFAGLGCDDSDVEVGDQQGYGGVFVGLADADVVESAVVAECDGACFVDAVVSDSEVVRQPRASLAVRANRRYLPGGPRATVQEAARPSATTVPTLLLLLSASNCHHRLYCG